MQSRARIAQGCGLVEHLTLRHAGAGPRRPQHGCFCQNALGLTTLKEGTGTAAYRVSRPIRYLPDPKPRQHAAPAPSQRHRQQRRRHARGSGRLAEAPPGLAARTPRARRGTASVGSWIRAASNDSPTAGSPEEPTFTSRPGSGPKHRDVERGVLVHHPHRQVDGAELVIRRQQPQPLR